MAIPGVRKKSVAKEDTFLERVKGGNALRECQAPQSE